MKKLQNQYGRDFYAWTMANPKLLKQGRVSEIDIENIAEEIVRTLVGSMTLTLAVPITTGLAAYYYTKTKHVRFNDESAAHHHH